MRLGWVALFAMACACGRSGFAFGDGLGDDGLVSGDGGLDPPGLPDACDLDDHDSDCDGDGIPDADDPFPADPQRPGTVDVDLVYMHSSSTLSTIDFTSLRSDRIGDFSFPDQDGVGITDIAIDRFGVLYATSFVGLFACHPQTAECWRLADANANAAAVLPEGVLEAGDDALVVIERGTDWTHMHLRGGEVTPEVLGTIAAPLSSSGDLVQSPDGVVYFTSPSPEGEAMVAIDPRTADILSPPLPIGFAVSAYGLASVADSVFVFDALGAILRFDPETAETFVIVQLDDSWWGAASHPSQWR